MGLCPRASALTGEQRPERPCWLLCPGPRGFWNKTAFCVKPLLLILELKYAIVVVVVVLEFFT